MKATLDRFGTLGGSRRNADGDFLVGAGDPPAYWVTRGNHDRAHRGPLYEVPRTSTDPLVGIGAAALASGLVARAVLQDHRR